MRIKTENYIISKIKIKKYPRIFKKIKIDDYLIEKTKVEGTKA